MEETQISSMLSKDRSLRNERRFQTIVTSYKELENWPDWILCCEFAPPIFDLRGVDFLIDIVLRQSSAIVQIPIDIKSSQIGSMASRKVNSPVIHIVVNEYRTDQAILENLLQALMTAREGPHVFAEFFASLSNPLSKTERHVLELHQRQLRQLQDYSQFAKEDIKERENHINLLFVEDRESYAKFVNRCWTLVRWCRRRKKSKRVKFVAIIGLQYCLQALQEDTNLRHRMWLASQAISYCDWCQDKYDELELQLLAIFGDISSATVGRNAAQKWDSLTQRVEKSRTPKVP